MIVFNYQDAISQSDELTEVAECIKNLAEQVLHAGQEELRYSWAGDSADVFYKKTEELYKDITKTAQTASAVSKTVRSTAKAIKDAEDAAKELIRNTVKL